MLWLRSRNARSSRGSGSDVIIKIVTLFLIFIGVLAMFGKLRLPGGPLGRKMLGNRKCPSCGRYKIGKGPCPCGRDRG